MKVVLCLCSDEADIDARDIRLFLNSKSDVEEVEVYDKLCEKENEKKIKSNILEEGKEILLGACESRTPFSDDQGDVNILDLKNLCYSVHSDKNKINEKTKKLLAEKINEINNKENFFLYKKRSQKNVLTMEPGIGGEEEKALFIDREHCPSTEEWSCSFCSDLCQRDAFNSKRMAVSEKKCSTCGICSNSCPLDLLELKPKKDLSSSIKAILSNVDQEKENKIGFFNKRKPKNGLQDKVIAFTCERKPLKTLKYLNRRGLSYPPEILPISVDCLSEIDMENILKVFIEGGQGTILLGCEDCFNKSNQYIENLVEKFNRVFSDTILEDRIKYLETTRSNYKKINKKINSFYSKIEQKDNIDLDPKEIRIRKQSLETYDTSERKKRIKETIHLLEQLGMNKDKLGDLFPICVPKIDKNRCNGCGKCANVCSTEAIQVNGDIMVLQEWKCLGCEKCIETCPKNAIELEKDKAAPSLENKYFVSNSSG